MTESKVSFGVSMSKEILKALEEARGTLSRSLVIEAMVAECLCLPDEVYAKGICRNNYRTK